MAPHRGTAASNTAPTRTKPSKGPPAIGGSGWWRWGVCRGIDTVPEGDFYVRALAVDPDHRGRGIGTRLLGFLEQQAVAAGTRRIALDVAMKNQRAQALYERQGFTIAGESPRFFGLPNTNVARMAKSL